jgi:putative ribosome biogenesis GTPase RsgA
MLEVQCKNVEVQVELFIYMVTLLHSICRLELKGDKNVLGEFIEFKGRHEDIQLLKILKRSKVSRFIIQKSTLFGGFGKFHEPSVLVVLFASPYLHLNFIMRFIVQARAYE